LLSQPREQTTFGFRRDRREAVFLFPTGQFANVCFWHIADNPTAPALVRFWDQSGQRWILARDGVSATDPTVTLAVHCGNGFDADFSLYRSTRLSR
jgi:hypothetical protein